MTEIMIRQESGFLMETMRMVRSGRAVPAAFQRPYVWSADDIVAMWTSILKGYPLGAFLLWRPAGGDAARYARTTLGPIAFTADQHASLILDGQNRLVSLAWSQTPHGEDVDPATPGYAIWRCGQVLVADPHRREVRFVPETEAGSKLMMPVSHLFDNSAMQRYFRTHWDGNDAEAGLIEWLDGLIYKVNGARIVTTTIENASPAEAIEAFRHIARVGVPVSDSDLEAALSFEK